MPWVPRLALDGDFGWSVALATLNSPWWMVDGSKQQCDKPNIVTNPKITMNCWYPNGRCGIACPHYWNQYPNVQNWLSGMKLDLFSLPAVSMPTVLKRFVSPWNTAMLKTHLPSGKHGIPNKMMANFRWDPRNSSKFLWWLSSITHTLWQFNSSPLNLAHLVRWFTY